MFSLHYNIMNKIVKVFHQYFWPSFFLICGLTLLSFWIYLLIPIDQNLLNYNESTIIYDRNEKKLYEILQQNTVKSQYVKYQNISPYFINALIATEDKRFYSHGGIDFLGIMRATKDNILMGKVVSGASTISQQVAKNLLSHSKRGYKEKIEETMLAIKLEKQLGKEKILELYANNASFGSNLVGVETASQTIFQKPALNLDLAESAFLAGIPKSPTRYSPFDNFENAKQRQEFVLKRMLKENLINEEEYQSSLGEELQISTEQNPVLLPHFIFFLQQEYPEIFDNQKAIITTIDAGLQNQVEEIINQHLALIGEKHNISNCAVLVFEAKTGKILVMTGSKDFFDKDIDGEVNVLSSKRQVGSTLKPFLYLLAFQNLHWTPDTTIIDEPVGFETSSSAFWEPKNYDLTFHGEVSVREALAQSLNVPAAKTLNAVGVDKFLNFLEKFGMVGIDKSEDWGLSVALGTPNIRPLDLAHAYGILAREGQDFDYQVLESGENQKNTQLADKELVLQITDILSNNQARINAFGEESVLNFDYSVAVKTGTTRDFRDNYTVGYTREIVVLVWIGNADNSPMRNVSGITGAGPLFRKIMDLVMVNYAKEDFPKPNYQKSSTIENNDELRILYPINGSTYQLDPEKSPEDQKIKFTANKEANWSLSNEDLGQGKEVFWIPKKGRWQIKAVYEDQEQERVIYVE